MLESKDRSKRYKKVSFLGEGAFATVYKAEDIENENCIVAVKKIKLGDRSEAKDGINRTALREIKLLQELHHPNIIRLLDVFGHKSSISLVFDFMETDLELIIKDTSLILSPPHIKSFILMTIQGLEFLHSHWVLHRDMKPNNLLLDSKGILKIGDFGLAKTFGSPNRIYTNQVVTPWYRCPELLFGAKNYGTGIDMWAVGCVLAELLLRVPFLPGDSDLSQLSKIFETLGTPTTAEWPELKELSDFVEFKKFPRIPLHEIFSAAGDDLLDLLNQLFLYNPLKRITASQALKHPYFSNRPAPTPCELLPQPGKKLAGDEEVKSISISLKRKLNDSSDHDITAKKLIF
ncbi:cyclin-dependent kinase 7 isoform X1 [Hydra vulgaris]|uniref:Cyclin-dependent kinase 7 n=1 Tax=Hydra vulgaris TaxID=6087 RepID=T2MFX7_HYDVU|nr:cyclin-dependent kinase 7 [Hydra vulgaris]QOY46763.1 cyclin-dependent kinase 7 [Hydra vulgaris]